MSDPAKNLLVYMPALNEEQSIPKVLKSVPKTFDGCSSVSLLVIDDGSTDETAKVAKKGSAKVITHKSNRGVGIAFQTAATAALEGGHDVLVSIDADGQFNPDQIPFLLRPILKGEADFSIGNRFYTNSRPKNMSRVKYYGNKAMNRLVSFAAGQEIKDASCGFRAYSRECLLSLNLMGSYTYTHETILDLANKGFVPAQIPVEVKYFEDRVSRVASNIPSYAYKSAKIIFKTFRDYRPFRLFGSLALLVFCIGAAFGGFVGYHWYTTGGISPYKSFGIISAVLGLMSLALFALALLADMLGRMRRNQERLLYFLKKEHYG